MRRESRFVHVKFGVEFERRGKRVPSTFARRSGRDGPTHPRPFFKRGGREAVAGCFRLEAVFRPAGGQGLPLREGASGNLLAAALLLPLRRRKWTSQSARLFRHRSWRNLTAMSQGRSPCQKAARRREGRIRDSRSDHSRRVEERQIGIGRCTWPVAAPQTPVV